MNTATDMVCGSCGATLQYEECDICVPPAPSSASGLHDVGRGIGARGMAELFTMKAARAVEARDWESAEILLENALDWVCRATGRERRWSR